MAMRWNFHLGPLQFSSPVGVISVGLVVLCCCGSGIAGKFMDDPSPPAVPVVVQTSAPATPAAVRSARPTTTAAKAQPVSPGAFCDTVGDAGVSKTGTPMVCKGPGDLRWRRR